VFNCVGVPYRELFPSSRSLFMYRDVEKVVKSVYRASMITPLAHLIFEFGKLSSYISRMMIDAMGLNGSDYCVRIYNNLVPGVIFSAVITTMYLDSYRRGSNVRAVRYEDLVARPLDMCRTVLEFCHLPVSLAELAVKAFEVDSQRNSILRKSVLGRIKEPKMTPQIKEKLNELLKEYGMPPIGESCILEGTLTCC